MRVPYVDLAAHNGSIRAELVAAVERVLGHGQLILGAEVESLEERLAARLGVRHAVTVASGTDALLLALRASGVGPDNEVVVPSHSFVATASAVVLAGAMPVFADVDARTMLLDPSAVEAALTPRTRAVVPVHLGGHACDLDALAALCARYGLALVEDCAQAFGTEWRGRPVGGFGVGAFSFHPLKVLSACGDGGCVTTSDDAIAAQLRLARNLGLRTRDECAVVAPNSRLDALQAAILGVKLDHVDAWIAARRAHAEAYRAALGPLVELPPGDGESWPTYSTFVIRHDDRDNLVRRLLERGVEAKVHYPLAIHQQAAFARFVRGPLPVTEQTVRRIASLPVTPEMSAGQRAQVVAAVRAAAEAAHEH